MAPLDVDGISGEDVKDFLVSRDGSRLIAVIRQNAEDDAIVVSRIQSPATARWWAPSPPRTSPTPTTWTARSGTSPGARRPASPCCSRSPATLFQVRSASVDGAGTSDSPVGPIDEPVVGLIGTPVDGEPIYAFTEVGDPDRAWRTWPARAANGSRSTRA